MNSSTWLGRIGAKSTHLLTWEATRGTCQCQAGSKPWKQSKVQNTQKSDLRHKTVWQHDRIRLFRSLLSLVFLWLVSLSCQSLRRLHHRLIYLTMLSENRGYISNLTFWPVQVSCIVGGHCILVSAKNVAWPQPQLLSESYIRLSWAMAELRTLSFTPNEVFFFFSRFFPSSILDQPWSGEVGEQVLRVSHTALRVKFWFCPSIGLLKWLD